MADDYTTLRARAVAALKEARAGLAREIAEYPTPIAGCDAQYNHLLAERKRLRDALTALAGEVFIATPRMLEAAGGVESR